MRNVTQVERNPYLTTTSLEITSRGPYTVGKYLDQQRGLDRQNGMDCHRPATLLSAYIKIKVGEEFVAT